MSDRQADAEYISARVDVTVDGCWEWKLSLNNQGYGLCKRRDHRGLAHRFAYAKLVGDIPTGLQLDHLCRNKKCVNPAHLEPVTASENLLRAHAHSDHLSVYRQGRDGLWCAAIGLRAGGKKSFRSKDRATAESKARAWLATNDR